MKAPLLRLANLLSTRDFAITFPPNSERDRDAMASLLVRQPAVSTQAAELTVALRRLKTGIAKPFLIWPPVTAFVEFEDVMRA